MMTQQQQQDTTSAVAAPVFKTVTSLLAGFGIATWSDAAAAIAFFYTLCLLLEWVWKKFGRPFAEKRKWITRKVRRRTDADYYDD